MPNNGTNKEATRFVTAGTHVGDNSWAVQAPSHKIACMIRDKLNELNQKNIDNHILLLIEQQRVQFTKDVINNELCTLYAQLENDAEDRYKVIEKINLLLKVKELL